jgi:hypothetical protein
MGLRINISTHQRPGRTKLLKSLYPIMYVPVHLVECVTCCRVEGEEMSEDRDYVWDHYQESVKVMYKEYSSQIHSP